MCWFYAEEEDDCGLCLIDVFSDHQYENVACLLSHPTLFHIFPGQFLQSSIDVLCFCFVHQSSYPSMKNLWDGNTLVLFIYHCLLVFVFLRQFDLVPADSLVWGIAPNSKGSWEQMCGWRRCAFGFTIWSSFTEKFICSASYKDSIGQFFFYKWIRIPYKHVGLFTSADRWTSFTE